MSYQEQFEIAFIQAINDRLLYIPEQIYKEYTIEDFDGYDIYINQFVSGGIYRGYIRKDGQVVYNQNMGTELFRNIIDKIEGNYYEKQNEYFATLIEELEWKSKDEMSPVFQDVKRLKEITEEATSIHNKYKKSFFNLFS